MRDAANILLVPVNLASLLFVEGNSGAQQDHKDRCDKKVPHPRTSPITEIAISASKLQTRICFVPILAVTRMETSGPGTGKVLSSQRYQISRTI